MRKNTGAAQTPGAIGQQRDREGHQLCRECYYPAQIWHGCVAFSDLVLRTKGWTSKISSGSFWGVNGWCYERGPVFDMKLFNAREHGQPASLAPVPIFGMLAVGPSAPSPPPQHPRPHDPSQFRGGRGQCREVRLHPATFGPVGGEVPSGTGGEVWLGEGGG